MTDLHFTIRLCVVSDSNLACVILIRHITLSEGEVKFLSAPIATVFFVPQPYDNVKWGIGALKANEVMDGRRTFKDWPV